MKFSYYSFGSHIADITFDSEGVLHRRKDRSMSSWGEQARLGEEEHVYSMPLYKLWKSHQELTGVRWDTSDDVTLLSGEKFQRHVRTQGQVKGDTKEGWVWALQDTPVPTDLVVADNRVVGFIQSTPRGCNILVELHYENLTPLGSWNNPLVSQPRYGIRHLGTFHVPMRDGVKLATDVWLPEGMPEGSEVPVILGRTCYGRIANTVSELGFVERGYAFVAQDVRGRDDSEGEWIPFVNEADDGNDTLIWIAEQPWCNGDIGMIGGSYWGYTQWAAAASGNPGLKAIVSIVTAGTPFVDSFRPGGTILSFMMPWMFMMSEQRMNGQLAGRDDWYDVLKARPLSEIPQKTLGKNIPFWDEFMKHQDQDVFWKRADWKLCSHKIDVPALYISGWYDADAWGTPEAWEMNQKSGRQNQRLIYGPWAHAPNMNRDMGSLKFSNDAIRYDMDLLFLRWFDRFLKGVPNGVEEEGPVEYYVLGANRWESSLKWPPEDVQSTNVYLHSNGNASSKGGQLGPVVPGTQPEDCYSSDPENPASYLGNEAGADPFMPTNFNEVEQREDMLVYTSEPLLEPVLIAGHPRAIIYASSSARDTDWVVRLTEVDEEGNSIRLSDGIIRARYRKSYEQPELLVPGQIERYEFPMTKIAHQFKRGRRLRVHVTSGTLGYAFPNHNTGEDPATDTEFILAEQKVYHTSLYPSHVTLPILSGSINT